MKTQIVYLALFLLLCFAAAGIGGIFTGSSVNSEWYAQLPKPSWQPPNWLFGPVWTVLYTLMGVAGWLVWRRVGFSGGRLPLTLFFIQLALNVFWSYLFFGLRLPGAAFVEIIFLWVAILFTLISFWRVSLVAGILFVPYLLWVTFAAVLNYSIGR